MRHEIVITKDAAMEILRGWCDWFSEPIDDQTLENTALLKAVMQGRVDFDEDKELFSLKLRKPIELDNGETVASITMCDPGSAHALDKQKVISKGKSLEMELDTVSSKLVSATGLALGVLRRLSLTDYNTMDNLLVFFS
jgi:hypothetical protein